MILSPLFIETKYQSTFSTIGNESLKNNLNMTFVLTEYQRNPYFSFATEEASIGLSNPKMAVMA
jgi:hypothetical protein